MGTKQTKEFLRPKKIKLPMEGIALSSGSSMLNLGCTGKIDGCFLPGHYYFLVGSSDSGKTFLSLTLLAEAAANHAFDNYRFVYDAPEGGALMDIRRFFGIKVAERLEPPEVDEDGAARHSETSEEFYYHVDDALKGKRPCIYILDSQDCLSSKAEIEKFKKTKSAFRKGTTKDQAGSYGDGKAKSNSANLRRLMGPLARTGSILIIISQERDSFDMFEKATHSGGRALKFYATLQLWSTCAGKISKTVMGKPRQLGVNCKVRVKKNRVTGRDRTVIIPIYHSYGIDDVGGMVDYLIAEGVWKETDGKVKVTGLGPDWPSGRREKVIKRIEDEELVEDLKELVAVTWQDIEDACVVERKRRYE
ncbi:DNA recombination/repair protein RecA [Candidatus Pacearchaeota archaeon]|nr:DNA recombination/repair protein RecA [Candidatus Pacearchaeota archaeon]